jgi:hypothetical protein
LTEHSTISIQESTAGGVSHFLETEGCECIQSIKLLSFLSGALQRYEEEGVLLNPKLVLCNSIEIFTESLPGGRYVLVGTGKYSADTGKNVLKQCAILAKSGWHIFIERSPDGSEIRFGVFSYLASPTSLNLREMIEIGVDESLGNPDFSVLIEQIDPKTIVLTGARGNSLKIAFSTTRVIGEEKNSLDEFAGICMAGCDVEDGQAYFRNLLARCLNECHGTILVCSGETCIAEIEGMQDAVVIAPPLDLPTTFTEYKASNSADAILELQRSESLLVGIMQSDGIIAFDERGRVTAYRVFFRQAPVEQAENPKAAPPKPIGGARRRAFEGLKPLVGTALKGALFRSQDGLTEFHGG